MFVVPALPRGDLRDQRLRVRDPLVGALSGEDADFSYLPYRARSENDVRVFLDQLLH